MDEYIEVIDDSGNVISQELKSVCHSSGLLHKVAMLLIFKDESYKELLFVRRGKGAMSSHGKLAFAGGHMAPGEESKVAVLREFEEECFVNRRFVPDKEVEFLFVDKGERSTCNSLRDVFFTVYDGPFYLDNYEAEECLFLSVEDAFVQMGQEGHPFSPTTMHILAKLREVYPTLVNEKVKNSQTADILT